MAAVLDDVGKSKVSKKTSEEVFENAQEDIEDGSTATKKRRTRRKKKAQTDGIFINSIFIIICFVFFLTLSFLYHPQCIADKTETNEKENEQEQEEEEVASGVTNINMEDEVEGEKKKPRRRAKKKEIKDKPEPESKEKKQTDPPSVPIHELFPTSKYLF